MQTGVPPNVIRMNVCMENEINLLRLDTHISETLKKRRMEMIKRRRVG
ncbi:hypothetical protein ATPR_3486 [Acetobacter tropicalis NBRC 101654]|uniref:Uncharacterized protein n=1 Tax=Acetobacter tropicalis NBRC 101654 TaxID=749388 RepID=F7VJD8_9PROT|nr:hypothetical protein ATPR_3486 [Acetobacter tropicalis NBRC 101654]